MTAQPERENAHTPGPWKFKRLKDGFGFYDAAGEAICGAESDYDPLWLGEPSEANAALIARAPDLLVENERLKANNAALREACKWAEGVLAPFSKEPAERSGINMLRAALKENE